MYSALSLIRNIPKLIKYYNADFHSDELIDIDVGEESSFLKDVTWKFFSHLVEVSGFMYFGVSKDVNKNLKGIGIVQSLYQS